MNYRDILASLNRDECGGFFSSWINYIKYSTKLMLEDGAGIYGSDGPNEICQSFTKLIFSTSISEDGAISNITDTTGLLF